MQPIIFTRAILLKEAKALLLLAAPIIANGLLESSYGFTNAFMAAKLGITELAVNALVSLLFFTLMVIFWGVISATSIIISHYHGAENTAAIRGVVRDSLWLSLIMSIPIMLLLWFAPNIFLWTGQSIFVVHEAEKYLHALTWAVPSDLLGFVLMQFFQGISRPRIVFIMTLAYIPLLIATNYILIFGKLGFPALGLAGIGWGVTFVYTVVLIAMGIIIWFKPVYRQYIIFREASRTHYFRELLHVGLPMGGMFSIEIGCFLIIAIFMGKISATALAANQIIQQYLGVAISVVFSIGQAVSIRIGWRLGRQEPEWVLPLTWLGQSMAFIYMLAVAVVYWVYPEFLIALDLNNVNSHFDHAYQAVVSIAVTLFVFLALFQCAESVRITLFSVLRGLKDTRFTMIVSIITFWGIALPLGYYLAFRHTLSPTPGPNPAGLWQGLFISALVGGVILSLRLQRKLRQICPKT